MPATELKGLRVLVVEDQMIVALHMEGVLHDAGCEVVGPIANVLAAITVAHEEALDVAILDVNVDGDRIFPVADELQARGIPFILSTGYAEPALPEKWRQLPRLSKPFRAEQLEQLIRRVASRCLEDQR